MPGGLFASSLRRRKACLWAREASFLGDAHKKLSFLCHPVCPSRTTRGSIQVTRTTLIRCAGKWQTLLLPLSHGIGRDSSKYADTRNARGAALLVRLILIDISFDEAEKNFQGSCRSKLVNIAC